ncbi:hypothetical protein ACTMU2_25620 [Cupriavidus basilensis]
MPCPQPPSAQAAPKSIATVSLSGTLPEKLEAPRRPGSTAWRSSNDLLNFDGSPAEVCRMASDLGLRIMLYQPLRIRGDARGTVRAQYGARRAQVRRDGTGLKPTRCWSAATCRTLPSTTPRVPLPSLRQMAEALTRRGLRVGFEALALGPPHAHLAPGMGHRAARGPPGTRPGAGQLPIRLRWATTCRGWMPCRRKRSSLCSLPTPRACQWTCWAGAGTTAAFLVRATCPSPRSRTPCCRPAMRARCRWKSSTTSSAPRPHGRMRQTALDELRSLIWLEPRGAAGRRARHRRHFSTA